jgi:HEAT repeat protein
VLRRALLCCLLVLCTGFEWPGEVYRIQRALEHSEPAQRRELVRKLAQHGAQSAREPLLRALEDADAQVRLEAAAVTGRVRLREAVPILLDWLDDKEPATRRAAAAALGEIGEERALQALIRALGDGHGDVRRAAVVALGELSAPDALVPLIGRLEDVDLGVRLEAIAALGALRDGRAVVPLLGAAADASSEVRAAALGALGRIGDVRALPALTRSLSDEIEDVQLAAAAALGTLGDGGGVRPLKAGLERADPRLGQAILAALGNIDDRAARELLVAQLAVPALRKAAELAIVQQARHLARKPTAAATNVTPPAQESPTPSPSAPAPLAELVSTLGDALRASGELPVKLAIADTLAAIAEIAPIDPALDALLAELGTADGALTATLMRALGASGAAQALMPLLERLAEAKGETLNAALDALQRYFERAKPDGRAADPLLERLSDAPPEARVKMVELLGRVGAVRALPAITPLFAQREPALRLAAIRAAGALGSKQAAAALLPLLDASDPATRFEAARALRTSADVPALEKITAALAGRDAADRHALLVALGGGLLRARQRGDVPETLEAKALETLGALAHGDDEALSDRAMDAIAVWQPARALDVLAANLRSPSARRRAVAIAAIGQIDGKAARGALRHLLRGGTVREAAAAALALAELGDERDVAALVKTARRRHWPVPGAAAYALARFAQRGTLRPHAAARDLCAFGRSREPYVRANVAAAMAALGARPCEEDGPDPLQWLEPEHAPVVRAAAARWAHAAAVAGRLDATAAHEALERCAAFDPESSVREVCAAPELPTGTEPTDVYAYAPDGVALLRDRLVALRLADGTVYLGYSDRNGHVRLERAPRGPLRLEDAALTPLEPAN